LLSRLTTDTELIQTVVGSSASVALRNFLLFIGAAVLLAVTSLKLTLWVALLVPIVVASLPPASSFILGPWIQKHVETGLVWWGVYAIVVYPVSYWLAKVDWSQVYY